MVFAEGNSEGTSGPNGDVQSTVCLLAADSENDLQNVLPNVDQPPASEGSAPAGVVQNKAKKEMHRQCSSRKPCLLIFAFSMIVFLLSANSLLLFYILFRETHDRTSLQTLTEKLDAQSQILQQMAANQHLAGYNPGGL